VLRRATLLLAALAAALCAASAQGTPPGTNGRIVYTRLRFLDKLWGELYTASPAGSDARRLTQPTDGTQDIHPDWSPDGSRIAFERAPAAGAHSIWTVAADGTGLQRLTPACAPRADIPTCRADDATPAWSPDGRHIAFQRASGALRKKNGTVVSVYRLSLVVADASGRNVRTLVWLGPWRGDVHSPAWSPDGKELAFIGEHMTSKTNGTGCACPGLYVVNEDGSGLRRITPAWLHVGLRPDWSPDGSTILAATEPVDDTGLGANLYTIHPNGTALRKLTHLTGFERLSGASWSPDGTSIVAATSRGATGVGWPDLDVMRADGTGLQPVTHTRNFEDAPDWGPS
jgi:Tol biopolymer transport system component